MKHLLQVTTTVNQPELLKKQVESLASRSNTRYGISSAEANINGIAAFNGGTGEGQEDIRMLFTTSFLFTCTKVNKGEYKIRWSNSLS